MQVKLFKKKETRCVPFKFLGELILTGALSESIGGLYHMSSKKSTKNGCNTPTHDVRSRTFATIVYPDSAPEGWRSRLDELHVPCLISPLHDRDINADGTPKKPHFHLVFHFEGKKNVDVLRELFSSFGGVGVESVNSMRGYARYLCHLDNPEKAQYSPSDVVSLGGIDYSDLIASAADRHALIRDICTYCIEADIREFSDLVEYALLNNEEWFNALSDNCAYIFKEYIRSRRHRAEKMSNNE